MFGSLDNRIDSRNRLVSKGEFSIASPELLFPENKSDSMEISDFSKSQRDRLTATKSKLDNYDLKVWGDHTDVTEETASVSRTLRQPELKVEMSTVAWCKMLEMMDYHILPPSKLRLLQKDQPIYSVHICEAPGAFISATNHFMKQHGFGNWDWIGNSLNPYYEGNDLGSMIDDDRLIIETSDKWFFGADNSGDVMRKHNVESLWKHANHRFHPSDNQKEKEDGVVTPGGEDFDDNQLFHGEAFLVTSDGSVDCSFDPNRQEIICASLHYCEAVTAFGLLKKGGHFIIKVFTIFEPSSIHLLYLLSCLFDRVDIFKPFTSKSGNSELYVMCKGFRGITQPLLQKLLNRVSPSIFVDDDRGYLFPTASIPSEFLKKVEEVAAHFADLQIQKIESNIHLFLSAESGGGANKQVFHRIKTSFAYDWIKFFDVRPISSEQRLITKFFVDGGFRRNHTLMSGREKDSSGSLNERILKRTREKQFDAKEEVQKVEKTEEEQRDIFATMKMQFNTAGLGLNVTPSSNFSWDEEDEFSHFRGSIDRSSNTLSLNSDQENQPSLLNDRRIKFEFGMIPDHFNISKTTDSFDLIETRKLQQGLKGQMNGDYNHVVNALKSFCKEHKMMATAVATATATAQEVNQLKLLEISKSLLPTSENIIFKDWLVLNLSQNVVKKPTNSSDQENLSQTDGLNGLFKKVVDHDFLPSSFQLQAHSNVSATFKGLLVDAVGVDLIFGQSQSPKKDDEFECQPIFVENEQELRIIRKRLMFDVLLSFDLLNPGGTLVLSLWGSSSRFFATFFYLLQFLFARLTLMKPINSSKASSERFLICQGFQRNETVEAYFQKIGLAMKEETNAKAVLECVSITLLSDSPVHGYLLKRNNYLIDLQLKALRKTIVLCLSSQNDETQTPTLTTPSNATP